MDIEKLKEDIRHRLKVNRINEGTKRALRLEMEFLQGYIQANKDIDSYYALSPAVAICMLSGVSVLTL